MAKKPAVITPVKNLNGDIIELAGPQLTRWNRYSGVFEPEAKSDSFNEFKVSRLTIEEWLMVPNFKHNRPWLARFCDASCSHLVGALTSPEQVIVRALVDKDGNRICKLDGHSRTGAWLAGALERPRFVQCIDYTLPEGETIDGPWVEALFESINNKASAPSNAELEASAQSRLAAKGDGLDLGSSLFVKRLNLTAFKAAATHINKPRNPAAPVYWREANASLMYVLDVLAFEESEILSQGPEGRSNCYTAVVSAYVMKTLTDKNPLVVEVAFDFWLKWGQTDAPAYIWDTYLKVAKSDQSGAGAKAKVVQYLESAMGIHFKNYQPVVGFELPKPDQDADDLEEALANTTEAKAAAAKEKEATEKTVAETPFYDSGAVSMPPVGDVDVSGENDDFQDAPKAADGEAIPELAAAEPKSYEDLQKELQEVMNTLEPLEKKKLTAKNKQLDGEEFREYKRLTGVKAAILAELEKVEKPKQ